MKLQREGSTACVTYSSSMNALTIRRLLVLVVGLALLASACVTPIGVTRGSTQEMHYALTANVLSAGEPSNSSRQVLHRTNLSERFAADPKATLGTLHKTLAQPLSEDRMQDRLFALAELSFLHAEQTGESGYYLAAAVYA
jgi:hypothetical protein